MNRRITAIVAGTVALGLLCVFVPEGHAFSSTNTYVCVSSVTITGTPTAELSVSIKNISDNVTTGYLTWDGIVLGTTKWKASLQYLEVNSTDTNPSWGIQVYTDNKSSRTAIGGTADPQYSGVGKPVGLVGVANTETVLATCWHIKDNTTDYTALTIYKTGEEADPHLYQFTDASGNNWKFMEDCGADASWDGDGYYYITPWNQTGILYGEAADERASASTPVCLYIGADFTQASYQAYRTSKLILEQYHP